MLQRIRCTWVSVPAPLNITQLYNLQLVYEDGHKNAHLIRLVLRQKNRCLQTQSLHLKCVP